MQDPLKSVAMMNMEAIGRIEKKIDEVQLDMKEHIKDSNVVISEYSGDIKVLKSQVTLLYKACGALATGLVGVLGGLIISFVQNS